MRERARWSLKVSRETDSAVRIHLAARGRRKGDLSRFVEEAVNRATLRETVLETQARSVNLDPDEIEDLIDEGLDAVAPALWGGRHGS